MLDQFLEKLPIKPLYLAFSASGVGLVVILILVFSSGQSSQEVALVEDPLSQLELLSQGSHYSDASSKATETVPSSQSADKLVVDIKGQIKSPGVYEVAADARVHDVVKLAGGLTEKAEPKSINLAAKLRDETVIYVAAQGETTTDLVTAAGSHSLSEPEGGTETSGQVNLNTASQAELQTITGVGQKRAQDIIAYREANGGFKTVDELSQVSGIGDKTLENMRPYVSVD